MERRNEQYLEAHSTDIQWSPERRARTRPGYLLLTAGAQRHHRAADASRRFRSKIGQFEKREECGQKEKK